MAKITYHKSHKIVTNYDVEYNFVTQLYQTGVYGIINNRSDLQSNFTPQQIKKIEKDNQKQLEKGEIKSFELGTPITVTDESGFWKEVKD